jgi:hypothetical protein
LRFSRDLLQLAHINAAVNAHWQCSHAARESNGNALHAGRLAYIDSPLGAAGGSAWVPPGPALH